MLDYKSVSDSPVWNLALVWVLVLVWVLDPGLWTLCLFPPSEEEMLDVVRVRTRTPEDLSRSKQTDEF